jgi:hypothetical protein
LDCRVDAINNAHTSGFNLLLGLFSGKQFFKRLLLFWLAEVNPGQGSCPRSRHHHPSHAFGPFHAS